MKKDQIKSNWIKTVNWLKASVTVENIHSGDFEYKFGYKKGVDTNLPVIVFRLKASEYSAHASFEVPAAKKLIKELEAAIKEIENAK